MSAFPRYFMRKNGPFVDEGRTYIVRCDGPENTTFVFSDGEEELAGDWPNLATCLSMENWVEFSESDVAV